jgi:tetratricopeptide (TPR) repeat protein
VTAAALRRVAGGALLALACGLPVGARAQNAEALESRAKAFYEQLERGQRDRAAAEAPGLERDLATAIDQIEDRLETLRDGLVERDGDIEALYASPEWRRPEIESLVLSYHLAWVRYQYAQLTGDAARKKKLLTVVADVPEIYADSLYGRGLAYLDLGQYGKAIDDLQAAAQDARTAAKAKGALEEAKRRQNGGRAATTPPPDDPEVLAGKLKELLARVKGGDAADTKPATELARGLAARGGPWPARIADLVAQTLGDGTPASVKSSYGLWLLGQLAIDRNRCADVAPLVAAGAEVNDAGRATWRPELLFLDAGCRLNAGQRREAAEEFGALLKDFPQSDRAREVAYYRFRALDLARVQDPKLEPALEEAVNGYLQRWPKTEQAGEAHYVLAELARAQGDCARAAAQYAQVGAGPYAAKARLGALQCRVSQLTTKTPEPERAQLAKDLAAAVQAIPPRGADEELVARGALMGALVAVGKTPPDQALALGLVQDFEKKYPNAKELHPRAAEVRVTARVATGQLAEASAELEPVLAAGIPTERRAAWSRLGRELAGRGERAQGAEREQAFSMARKVFTALVAADGTPDDRIVLADLELRAGDAARARALYDEALKAAPDSAEAVRGAARAAEKTGDVDGALAYWRRVVEASPPGGTAWYEARVAQVELLAGNGRKAEACQVLRSSLGRSTSTGGDVLAKRLAGMQPAVCP